MASLFGFKQQQHPTEVATKTACSKLSNNAALLVTELAREPAQGLLHVVVSLWEGYLLACVVLHALSHL